MLFTTSVAAMLFASTGLAQFTVESAPFNLFVTSADGKYSKTAIGACHSGALIESLCVGENTAIFNFNTSSNTGGDQPVFPGHSPNGNLVYSIPNAQIPVSQALQFYLPYSTNLGSGMFGIGGGNVQVNFDAENKLNIVQRYNDRQAPPDIDNPAVYSKWYVCQTNYAAYQYFTLNWLYGDEPVNPSCTAVTVERIFTSAR